MQMRELSNLAWIAEMFLELFLSKDRSLAKILRRYITVM